MADKGLAPSLTSPSELHSAESSRSVDDASLDRALLTRLIANGEVPFDVEMAEPLRSELASGVREERKRMLIRLIARLMAQRLHAARKEDQKA